MQGDAAPLSGKLIPGAGLLTLSVTVELGSHRTQTYWHHILSNNKANKILLTTF